MSETTAKRIDAEWDESVDRIPEAGLEKLVDFARKLPNDWDVKSMQAHTKSVTATVYFDDRFGPEAQAEALERLFTAVTLIETLVINLRHEREANQRLRNRGDGLP